MCSGTHITSLGGVLAPRDGHRAGTSHTFGWAGGNATVTTSLLSPWKFVTFMETGNNTIKQHLRDKKL